LRQIPFNNLKLEYKKSKKSYNKAIQGVLNKGEFILGEEVKKFEDSFAKYIGTKYCVGMNSGLDALSLSIRSMGYSEGDEIIVPSNTYIASIISITENQLTPILVEPDVYFNIDPEKIISKITNKTRAIMVVHLYGQSAQMDKIQAICEEYKLMIIEDCAQSHGSKFNGQMTGTFGIVGCFSFYPTKNLGAFGDGGAVCTNDYDLFMKLKMLRNYGSIVKYKNEIVGVNSRLDEIQAAILNVKLHHIDKLINHRDKIAKLYLSRIYNDLVQLPIVNSLATHVWHLFVVRVDDQYKFIKYLEKNGILTGIHYPVPPHLSNAYKGVLNVDTNMTELISKTVVSLPIFDWMPLKEVNKVISVINRYDSLD
jgi:dTDP-4-amino-4,6-dideoxygalactose transaminase